MTKDEMRRKNVRLRNRLGEVLEEHPELRDVTEGIALRQDLHVQVGTPFPGTRTRQTARTSVCDCRTSP
jgi:hypothetical protein